MVSTEASSEKKPRPLFIRIAIWVLPSLLIIFIAVLLYVRVALNSYLNSPAFRELLGHLTSQQLNARCEYEPFHYSAMAINADAFHAQGTAKAAFSQLDLDKIHVSITLGALWNRVLQIDEVNVARLQVSLGHTGAPPVPESEIGVTPEAPKPSTGPSRFAWLSPKLDLKKVVVEDTNLIWGENTPQVGSVKGSTVTVKPDGDNAWSIFLHSGTISQKGGPDLMLDHLDLKYESPVVTISDGLLKFPPGGDIALSGVVDTEKHLDAQIKINGIPLKPFLPPDMQLKLKGGTVFADIKVSGPMPVQTPPEVSGSGRLDGGDLEGIPALDFIAKFTRSPQYRKIRLDKASADFLYSGKKVTVSNIVIESRGLVFVQGGFVINNSNINGTFEIGVPHDLVKWLPGLESKVFTVSRANYRWATMHLTGPLSAPKEDLKARIELALAMSAVDMVEGAVKVIPKAPEVPKKLLDGIVKPLFK